MLLTALKVKLAAMVAVAGLDTAQIDKLGDATKGALETLEVQQKDDKIDKQKAFTDAITAIKDASDKGDPSASYVLAHWMTFGILQGAPAEQVLGLYKKAADAGQLQAMSELGALTLRGAQDQAKAEEGIALIKAASDKGELGAMRAYAQILIRGTNTLKADPKAAEALLIAGSERKDSEATLLLSQIYQSGIDQAGIAKDEKKALAMLDKAIEQGNATAMSLKAARLFNGDQVASGATPLVAKDPEAAIKMFKDAAEKGNAAANRLLGQIYESGQGIEKADPEEAFKFYEKAAQGGDPQALLRLGQAFQGGVGMPIGEKDKDGNQQVKVLVPVDPKRALDAFRMAAQAGVPQAFYAVGVYYETGTVVDKDPVKAFALLKRAADSGIPEAQARIAGFYQNGTGVTQDLIAAAGWYDRAAQSNYAPAHLALGNLYEAGLNAGGGGDNPANNSMAVAANHYNMAAEQGSAQAMVRLAGMYERGAATVKNEPDLVRALAYLTLAELFSKDKQVTDVIAKLKEKMKPEQITDATKFFEPKKAALEAKIREANGGAAAAATPDAASDAKGAAKGKGGKGTK